jgi:hypothetical protein
MHRNNHFDHKQTRDLYWLIDPFSLSVFSPLGDIIPMTSCLGSRQVWMNDSPRDPTAVIVMPHS